MNLNMKSLRENPSLPFNMMFNSCKQSSQFLAGIMMEQGRKMLPTAEDMRRMLPNSYSLNESSPRPSSHTSSMYLKLSLDMVFVILSFLTAEELAVFTTCVHKLDTPNCPTHPSLTRLWHAHLSRKWQFVLSDSFSEFLKLSTRDLRKIYPYARAAMGGGVVWGKGVARIKGAEGEGHGEWLVEYRGRVGEGNRSVRTVLPFPAWEGREGWARSGADVFATCCSLMLREMSSLLKAANGFSGNTVRTNAPLFSSPFVYLTAQKQRSVFVQPRSVHYYEIKILPLPPAPAGSPPSLPPRLAHHSHSDLTAIPSANPALPCVAIGLCTGDFQYTKRMPGWDGGDEGGEGWGYHGDDGKVFHKSGKGVSYAPPFGLHDVVGCGVCLDTREIFFTLNGVFMGVAFDSEHLPPPPLPLPALYPIVGVDANVRVQFNFGLDKPFLFDFKAFLEKRSM
eukprot:gene39615-48228_t